MMATNKDARGSYASVNGLNMYYEVHGAGRPLVLLHGGLGTIAGMFGQLLPPLAANRQPTPVPDVWNWVVENPGQQEVRFERAAHAEQSNKSRVLRAAAG